VGWAAFVTKTTDPLVEEYVQSGLLDHSFAAKVSAQLPEL
jgi:hypothetical protein